MGQRPPHVKPPAYLSKNVPVPPPAPGTDAERDDAEPRSGPTRYGDWVNKGIAIDF